VRRGDLEIGRFEVTRGQYLPFETATSQKVSVVSQDFPKNGGKVPRRVLLSAENLPVHGITLEQAQAYASWLGKVTGETWRVPYEDEVKELYENRDGENTLDYWAGYPANPEDAARLREKAKELGGTAPLLKEVGSFHGQGNEDEEPIYDLGGNVAEWVLTRDGKGKVMGGSADCPADPKSNCTPRAEYIGFRVVRGAAKPVSAKP
jgi:formylglycine-generating enzyme required for sulfatase activity